MTPHPVASVTQTQPGLRSLGVGRAVGVERDVGCADSGRARNT